MKYQDLSRTEKQLIASQYPYKSDKDLFNRNEYNVVAGFKSSLDLEEFKYKAAEEGVSLTKKRDFVTTDNGITSIIDLALGNLSEDGYRAALELSKIKFEPLSVLKELFAVEVTRLRDGIKYEKELGLGLNQDTQSAMNSLVQMTKVINDIENGQKHQIEFSNSLAGMIADIDFDDSEDSNIDDMIIDVDIL